MSTLQDRLAGLPEAPEPTTELAAISAIQQIVPAEFFKAGGSEDILTKLETEVRARAAKLDISTDFGRKEIASLAYKVARSKTALDKSGKDLTEDIRKQKEAIDAERRKVTERLDSLKEEVRKPLTDWEDAEKARVKGHEDTLADIAAAAALDRPLNLDEIEAKMAVVNLICDRDWEEFTVRAAGAKALAWSDLQNAAERARQAIAQREELERQHKEAEEKAIREREQAAAEAATKEAERKAQEAADAAQRAAQAERERLEREVAEQAARAKQEEARRVAEAEASAERERQAERQRLEDLRQAELRRERDAADAKRREEAAAEEARRAQERAVQAERDRQAAERREKDEVAERERLAEEKRQANKKHRFQVETHIVHALSEVSGMTKETASEVVLAIKGGQIPHVTLAY